MPVELALRASLVVGLCVATLLAGGCVGPPETASPPPPSAVTCQAVGPGLDLGASAYDVVPSSFATLSGGHYRVSATGFLHDGPFDPDIGRTSVVWGPRATPPRYDPGPATVSGASGQADVAENSPVVVELESGTWWFLNSNGVHITLEPCAPATAELVG